MVDFTEDFSQYALSKLPDIRENFNSYESQAVADLAWVSQDTPDNQVDVVNEKFAFIIKRNGTNTTSTFDLGAPLNDEEWILRLKVDIGTPYTVTSSLSSGLQIKLSDTESSAGIGELNNFLGMGLANTIIGSGRELQVNNALNGVGGSSATGGTNNWSAGETIYVELRRLSPVELQATIYTDAKYSIIRDRVNKTISKDTKGLRFINIGAPTDNEPSYNGVFTGTVDEIRLWGKLQTTPTVEDRFSLGDNWLDVGTGYGVNTGTEKLDQSLQGDGANNGASFDLQTILGGGNFADPSKWVLRYKLNVSSLVATTMTAVLIGLTDTDATVARSVATQDSIVGAVDLFNSIPFGYGPVGHKTNVLGLQATPANKVTVAIALNTDYWCELKRTSATTASFQLFTDSSFTTPLAGLASQTIPVGGGADIANLRYIRHYERDAGFGGTLISTVDDVQFFDGIDVVTKTTVKGAQQGDITLTEDFALKTAVVNDDFTVDNWVETGTLNQVNTGTQVLDFNFDRDTTNHKTVRDLTEVSDTEWTLRWCQTNATITQTGTPATLGYVGMIDTDNTTPANGVNDFIGLEYVVDNANNLIRLIDANGSALSGGTIRYTFTEVNAVNTRYWEVKRLSDVTMIANVYSDSTYTTLIETSGIVTCSASVIGLQHIGVITDNQATSVSAHDGTIDDMEFYNGNSVLTRWSNSGNKITVNTTNGVIDYLVDQTVAQGEAIHHDLGVGNVDDENWILRFKFDITNLNASDNANALEWWFGLSNNTGGGDTSQSWIAMYLFQRSTLNEWGTHDGLAQIPDNTSGNTNVSNAPSSGTFYCEIKRTSLTTYTITVYNNSDFTGVNWTDDAIVSASVTGLRYIKCFTSNDGFSTGLNTLSGTIDDVEFYNCVSVTKTPCFKTKEFEDNFWEDNWTDTGAQHGVNIGTQVIDWDSARLAEAINQTTFDLETVIPEGVNPFKWGLRFKFKFDAVTAGGASSQFAVFLTSLAGGLSSESAQDHATFKAQGNTPPTWSGMIDDATQIFTGSAFNMGTPLSAGEFAYGEMTRNGTLFTWAMYSDPDFTQLLGNGKGSVNDNSVLAGLRYLKIGRRDGTASAFTFNGTVDDIKFWNGSLPTEHGAKWVEVNVP